MNLFAQFVKPVLAFVLVLFATIGVAYASPSVLSVVPTYLATGKPVRLIVTGTGFPGTCTPGTITCSTAVVGIDGVLVSSRLVTSPSTSEIIVGLAPLNLTSGDHTLSVTIEPSGESAPIFDFSIDVDAPVPQSQLLPKCASNGDVAVIYNGSWVCKSSLPHYVDNGDGTVTDNVTGLQWEKKTGTVGTPNPADVHDANNTYTWSATGTAADGSLFATFLATLNGWDSYDVTTGQYVNNGVIEISIYPPSCFANRCGWRIPTIAELATILDTTAAGCNEGSPCIDPVFGPTPTSCYWSSSSGLPSEAWVDCLLPAYTNPVVYHRTFPKQVIWYARAVRGGR
jgi:hypothetical protein